jgi:nitrate/nitrite transporter NarK
VALALISAVGWALSPLALGHTALAVLLCSLAVAGTMGSLPVFWNLPTAMFQGAALAAAIALVSALGNLPGFFSPYVVAILKQSTGSLALPMYLFALVMALGAAVLACIAAPGRSGGEPASSGR